MKEKTKSHSMAGNNGKTKIDVAVLQTKVAGIEDRLGRIETNHLPHIQQAIQDLDEKFERKTDAILVETKQTATRVALIIGIMSLIAQILIAQYLR